MTVMSGSPIEGVPNWRRMRSVGHVGRNSETTLRITTLNNPGTSFGTTTTDKIDAPSLSADARKRKKG